MASHRIEIINELRALEQFCTFKAVRTADEQNRFLADYLADIQEFPLEAIQKACGEWRKSGATKFPVPGQLLPLIRKHVAEERAPAPKAWQPISDAEYGALSLRDKIRHQRILAHEASRKAGPQWANGQPVAAEDMPPTWRRWREIASGHHAEALRLSGFLRQPAAVAAE